MTLHRRFSSSTRTGRRSSVGPGREVDRSVSRGVTSAPPAGPGTVPCPTRSRTHLPYGAGTFHPDQILCQHVSTRRGVTPICAVTSPPQTTASGCAGSTTPIADLQQLTTRSASGSKNRRHRARGTISAAVFAGPRRESPGPRRPSRHGHTGLSRGFRIGGLLARELGAVLARSPQCRSASSSSIRYFSGGWRPPRPPMIRRRSKTYAGAFSFESLSLSGCARSSRARFRLRVLPGSYVMTRRLKLSAEPS